MKALIAAMVAFTPQSDMEVGQVRNYFRADGEGIYVQGDVNSFVIRNQPGGVVVIAVRTGAIFLSFEDGRKGGKVRRKIRIVSHYPTTRMD